MVRRGTWVLALGLLLDAGIARAGEPALDYQAPPPCPSADTVRAELRQLLQGSGTATDTFAFELRIAPDPAGFRGHLRATAPTPDDHAREVVDTSCGAVVHALAFIAAVVVDPSVAERMVAPLESIAPLEPAAPPVTPEPMPELAPPAPLPVKPAPVPARRARAVAPRRKAERPLRAGVFGAPVLETALGPDATLQARIGLYGGSPSIWRGTGWLAALSFVSASSNQVRTPVGLAELSWTRARADGCLSLPLLKPLLAYPCLSLDTGVLGGTGALSPVRSRSALWLAPGLAGRVALEFFNTFELFADLGGFVPVVRPRFFFATPTGEQLVHEVPAVGLAAGAGLALRVL